MFNPGFFPTPRPTYEKMVFGFDVVGKVILEPSGGKGDIVGYLQEDGAKEVIACEIEPELRAILQTKCRVIAEDFLTVTSDRVSHVDFIVMNPPFEADEKHILHAYEIAPPGCQILTLCNTATIENTYTAARKQLAAIVEQNGSREDLGRCFEQAERKTAVEVSLLKIKKPGSNYSTEFEGFFLEPDEEEAQENGIMPYNVVRDLVNRYVQAIKIFDEQLFVGVRMNEITKTFFHSPLAFEITENKAPKTRNEFKKDLQKSGWTWIFKQMNLEKTATTQLRQDINKFVEQQTEIPFTMRNIYRMLEIVAGTTSQRMDKAILEAFEKITARHDGNKFGHKGWKTNSHYLLTKKFIVPDCVDPAKQYSYESETYNFYSHRWSGEMIEDLEKAICFVIGKNWEEHKTLNHVISRNLYGSWYENHAFFKYKAFKVGTMHFEFKDEEIWAQLNQRISKIKGYPLFEGKPQTKYQDRQTDRAQQEKKNPAHAYKPTVLFEL